MNSDSRPQARQWLLKFSGGECSPREREAFRNWLQASAANQRAFDEIQQLWRELDQVEDGILAAHGAIPARTRRPAWPVAACAVITALFALLLWQWLAPNPDAAAPSLAHYSTATAELLEITLVDGSAVVLGARSRLTAAFDDQTRQLTLEAGEAWFEVVTDSQRPFVVVADGGSATAIGTAFSVHRGHDRVTVAVEEGVVAVRGALPVAGDAGRRLVASQRISYPSGGQPGDIEAVAPGQVGSWRQGRRVFRDTPLQELVADLNRYSPKPVMIADPRLRQVTVSGVFDQFADTTAVLRAIEQSQLARVVERNNRISLLAP